MNPIQVNCPECEKSFLVETAKLADGQARFQCTQCPTVFGFNWPQPPDAFWVQAFFIESSSEEASTSDVVKVHSVNSAVPSTNSSIASADILPVVKTVTLPAPAVQRSRDLRRHGRSAFPITRKCPKCGENANASFTECPSCGILFAKWNRQAPAASPIAASGADMEKLWEAVKSDYANESKHEEFIRMCMVRDNLVYATHQYKNILAVNPAETIAHRMQQRLLQIAQGQIDSSKRVKVFDRMPWGLTGFLIGLGGVIVISGLAIPMARSLVAVGTGISFFGFLLKYLRGH